MLRTVPICDQVQERQVKHSS